MYYYAMLNMNDVVWDVVELDFENVSTDYIQIDSYDTSLIGKWYDRSDNTFKEAPVHLQAEISSNVISYKDQDVWLNNVIDGKAEENHTHAEYAQVSHTHDYAPADHTHSIYSLSTHTHGYLPLSGGIMTGAITFSSTGTNIKKSTDDSSTVISGGTDTTSSYLQLNGKNNSSSIGFALAAHDGTTRYQLLGYKNGALLWNGKDVVRSINNIEADASGNVTLDYLPATGGTVSGEVNFSGGLVKVKGNQGLYATDSRLTVGSNNLETYIVGSTIYSRVAITVASDERLKEGIEDLDVKLACEFVNKLKVKEYNYIGCEDDRRIGVIAQDLIKADPELASRLVKEDKDGYLSVSYSELVGPLIVAVQQLQKRVEELEKSK